MPVGRRWLARCLVLVLALAGVAQAQVQTYRHFDDRDGLPQSQVTALLEDRDGFLWAGTAEGVARLGASGFQPFAAKQGLTALFVTDLMQDRAGGIWVASQEGGVDRILGGKITHFGRAEGLPVLNIYCLAENAAGELLAGTRLGLFRLRGGRFEAVDLPGGWSQEPIFAMAVDPQGRVWLASHKDRLARWDGRTLAAAELPGPMASRFRRLRTDASGQVWALSPDGLYRLDRGLAWVRDPLPGLDRRARLRNLQVTPQGELLLALDADGAYLRSPSGAGRVLSYLDGLPREGVASILRDSRGDLWLGTDGAGLVAEAVPGLLCLDRDVRTGVGLGLGTVLAFAELGQDRMLIGGTSGLRLWERGRGITGAWDQARGLPSNGVWGLAPRARGGAWVCTAKGLVIWEGGRIVKGPRELENVTTLSLVAHGGRLWVCTLEQGLIELDAGGAFIARHPAPAEVGDPAITAVIPRGDGLLAATRYGLYAFRAGVFRPALRGTPVGTRSISCLYLGPAGDLWVGTGSDGVFAFPQGEDGPCEPYSEANARIHGRVSWISRLGNGDLVVGHARGLSVLRSSRSGPRVMQITRNLGLLSNETSDSAVCRDHLGRLWIGMSGGLCLLDPAAELPDPGLPRPRILDATVGDLAFGLPVNIVLPATPGTLTLRFDAAKPLLPENPSYQVWIDGSWRYVEQSSTFFQIAHLGPGILSVRVRAGDGLGWAESDPVRIRVRAAWYQTSWARAGFALAGVALFLLLVDIRLKQVQKRSRMLEAKVQERTEELTLRNRSLERLHHQLKRSLEGRVQLMNTITHDLRSPLTSILISVERLEGNPGGPGASALKVLGREAQRVERLLKHLLDSSRAENLTDGLNFRVCHPGEVMEGLAETLHLKAESRDLTARIALDPMGDRTWILADAEAMQQVLFNLIENALKFTPAPGEIGIRSRLEPAAWVLEVWDTGRGIDPAQAADLFKPFSQAREADAKLGWGLGLSICRTLVEAHQGTIEVDSEPGKGSRFKVTLPLVSGKP
ncbi:sensor histidine kinase [Mesoterricola silvestris]|uniref:histidine kinase n=1 Tax=Mesoterricola silvestris TaxID=2927979 RepID=A0AA48GPD9_9BACT|nr:two-component regulator propeller domain-containing protein [Mesoterricola silvestris]BDU73664.1 histidine kinase [Mesoterricola silvestris]